jgi:hypothetical protein
MEQLEMLKAATPRFIEKFLSLLREDDEEKLKKMTLPIHILIHMPDFVQKTAPPPRRHWSFATERMCKVIRMITGACRDPCIAMENKLALRLLARINNSHDHEQRNACSHPIGWRNGTFHRTMSE